MRSFIGVILAASVILSACSGPDDETAAMCSPIIKNITGDAFTVIKCTSDKREYQQNLVATIAQVKQAFSILVLYQIDFLKAEVDEYRDNPTQENWELVRKKINAASELLDGATTALLSYRVRVQGKSPDSGKVLIERLRDRERLLQQAYAMENGPEGIWLEVWWRAYELVIDETRQNLTSLVSEWQLTDPDFRLHWPAFGAVVVKFGEISAFEGRKDGIEIELNGTNEIRAAQWGYVRSVTTLPGYGRVILIGSSDPNDSDYDAVWKLNGSAQFYANVSSTSLKVGNEVDQDDVIATFDDQRLLKDKNFFFMTYRGDNGRRIAENPLDEMARGDILPIGPD